MIVDAELLVGMLTVAVTTGLLVWLIGSLLKRPLSEPRDHSKLRQGLMFGLIGGFSGLIGWVVARIVVDRLL